MAIRADHETSRHAETFYEVQERFRGFALVRAFPKTGRTHQIRLHLLHIGCPVLCDKLYGGRSQITLGELRQITRNKHLGSAAEVEAPLLARQALHAHRLAIIHPQTGERMEFVSELPEDISRVLLLLQG